MNSAEHSVGSGIAEKEGELLSLHVYVQRARIGLGNIHRGPNLGSDEREAEDFQTDQNNSERHYGFVSTGPVLDFPLVISECPDKSCENKLRSHKQNSRGDH